LLSERGGLPVRKQTEADTDHEQKRYGSSHGDDFSAEIK
jgi:hypothetical protein